VNILFEWDSGKAVVKKVVIKFVYADLQIVSLVFPFILLKSSNGEENMIHWLRFILKTENGLKTKKTSKKS